MVFSSKNRNLYLYHRKRSEIYIAWIKLPQFQQTVTAKFCLTLGEVQEFPEEKRKGKKNYTSKYTFARLFRQGEICLHPASSNHCLPIPHLSIYFARARKLSLISLRPVDFGSCPSATVFFLRLGPPAEAGSTNGPDQC